MRAMFPNSGGDGSSRAQTMLLGAVAIVVIAAGGYMYRAPLRSAVRSALGRKEAPPAVVIHHHAPVHKPVIAGDTARHAPATALGKKGAHALASTKPGAAATQAGTAVAAPAPSAAHGKTPPTTARTTATTTATTTAVEQTRASAVAVKKPAKPAAADSAPSSSGVMREVYSYDPDSRRDPFVSLLTTGDLRPTINELKLMGILYDQGGRHSVAIMRDAVTNAQYRVTNGQQLGRMRVARISPKVVVFTIEEFGMNRQDSLVLGDTTKARSR